MPALPHAEGQRLLAVDVLPGLHGDDRDVGVPVVRSGDEDGVDVLLLLQHDPEVLVHGARVVGGLLGVVLLDLGPHRAPARLAAVVVRAEVPLLGHVGDGDDLAVVLLHEGAAVGPPLAPHADDRDVDLVARGHEPRAAENVAGKDRRDRRRGGRGGDEATTAGIGGLSSAHVVPSRQIPPGAGLGAGAGLGERAGRGPWPQTSGVCPGIGTSRGGRSPNSRGPGVRSSFEAFMTQSQLRARPV